MDFTFYLTNFARHLRVKIHMKKLKYSISILLLLSISITQVVAQTPVLKFRNDGTFKIVQFTDVHWKPGNPASNEAKERIIEVLDTEKPDLVLYTGDVIYGKPAEECLKEALGPVISRKIPFGVMFGNHDDESDMTREQIYAYLKKQPGNVTGTVEGLTGVSNYILSVKSADSSKDAAVLYCIDSNAYSTLEGVKGYGWIHPDQINWYVENSNKFTSANNGTPLPSLAFFHIPLPEYNEAASTESAYLIGSRLEKACAPQINTGMFSAMRHQKDVMATFVGHDHVNDYVAYWQGILLCYGRFTGGNTVYNGLPGGNGARVIELKEGKRGFRTWIRLKDNVIVNPIDYPEDVVKEKK